MFILNGTVVISQYSRIPHGKFPSPSISIPRRWSWFRILKFLKLHFELLKTSLHPTIRSVKILNLFCFDVWNFISWFTVYLIFSPLEYDNGKLVPPFRRSMLAPLLKVIPRSLLSNLLNHFSRNGGSSHSLPQHQHQLPNPIFYYREERGNNFLHNCGACVYNCTITNTAVITSYFVQQYHTPSLKCSLSRESYWRCPSLAVFNDFLNVAVRIKVEHLEAFAILCTNGPLSICRPRLYGQYLLAYYLLSSQTWTVLQYWANH